MSVYNHFVEVSVGGRENSLYLITGDGGPTYGFMVTFSEPPGSGIWHFTARAGQPVELTRIGAHETLLFRTMPSETPELQIARVAMHDPDVRHLHHVYENIWHWAIGLIAEAEENEGHDSDTDDEEDAGDKSEDSVVVIMFVL
jgi:hypothetical protein